MIKKSFQLSVLSSCGMLVALGFAFSGTSFAAENSKKSFAADKGPDKVDVAAFPLVIQEVYKTFSTKCSKCHTLARPINTNMDKAGWKRYVKRMMNKPDSGISPKSGKKIYKFLKYYQKVKDAKKAK